MADAPLQFESDFENYLAGRPLTPYLAAVKEGRELQPDAGDAPEDSQDAATGALKGRMTRKKRLLLRDATREPGWPVFVEFLNGLGDKREREAIKLSKEDPMGNEKAIAAEWLYVATYKRVLTDILAGVKELTATLDAEAKRKA